MSAPEGPQSEFWSGVFGEHRLTPQDVEKRRIAHDRRQRRARWLSTLRWFMCAAALGAGAAAGAFAYVEVTGSNANAIWYRMSMALMITPALACVGAAIPTYYLVRIELRREYAGTPTAKPFSHSLPATAWRFPPWIGWGVGFVGATAIAAPADHWLAYLCVAAGANVIFWPLWWLTNRRRRSTAAPEAADLTKT